MILTILFVSIAIIFVILTIDVVRNYIKLYGYNQSPLIITTWDGRHSPYHPSVLYFKESWNGWHYWMVETPFYKKGKPYIDYWECPSIHVSNDGVHWTEPTTNPIVTLTAEECTQLDYYSDPHLITIDKGNMECWYRINRRHGDPIKNDEVFLLRSISEDGISWTESQILAHCTTSSSDSKELGRMVVSPAVLYRQGKYMMWFVGGISRNSQRQLCFSSSSDAIHWENKQQITLRGADINPWHIDVNYIDNIYWMVIYDYNILTLWRSDDGLVFDYVRTLLEPSHRIGSFYSDGLYRACLIKAENIYKLYFSADCLYETHLGMMQGDSPEKLELVSIGNKPYYNLITFVRPYCEKQWLRIKVLVRSWTVWTQRFSR